jgi:uncharacterized membrane protein YuzA (DUF378 family)
MYIASLLWIARLLSALGAMNWGVVVFLGFNPVDYLIRYLALMKFRKVFYGLIAFAGFVSFISLFL